MGKMVWEQSRIIKTWPTGIFYGVKHSPTTDDIIFLYILFFQDIKGQTSYDWCRIFLISVSNGTEVKSELENEKNDY